MTHNDLHRTNINLYTTDVAYLRKQFGHGWTERVREMIASAVRDIKLRDKRTISGAGEISRRYIDNTEVPDDE